MLYTSLLYLSTVRSIDVFQRAGQGDLDASDLNSWLRSWSLDQGRLKGLGNRASQRSLDTLFWTQSFPRDPVLVGWKLAGWSRFNVRIPADIRWEPINRLFRETGRDINSLLREIDSDINSLFRESSRDINSLFRETGRDINSLLWEIDRDINSLFRETGRDINSLLWEIHRDINSLLCEIDRDINSLFRRLTSIPCLERLAETSIRCYERLTETSIPCLERLAGILTVPMWMGWQCWCGLLHTDRPQQVRIISPPKCEQLRQQRIQNCLIELWLLA